MRTVYGRCAAERGFTFAEVLAAMVFLAILIPAVVGGLSLGNRAAVIAERSQVALQLADQRLNELMLEDAWRSASSGGDFGREWPNYRWEMDRGSWAQGDMTELTLRVYFEVQGQEREVVLTTLADDSTE